MHNLSFYKPGKDKKSSDVTNANEIKMSDSVAYYNQNGGDLETFDLRLSKCIQILKTNKKSTVVKDFTDRMKDLLKDI